MSTVKRRCECTTRCGDDDGYANGTAFCAERGDPNAPFELSKKSMNSLDKMEDYDRLHSELEALKRERAMLVEALKRADECLVAEHYRQDGVTLTQIRDALSATEPQATQWLESKLADARQAVRDEVLLELSEREPIGWYDKKNSANYDTDQVTQYDKTIYEPTIIRPSIPKEQP